MTSTFPIEQMQKVKERIEEHPDTPLYKVIISFSNTYQGELQGSLNYTTIYDVLDVVFNEGILSVTKTYETLYFKTKHLTGWHVMRQ